MRQTHVTAIIIVWLLSFDSAAAYQAASRSDTRLPASIDRAVEEEVAKGFSGAVLVERKKSRIVDRGYGSTRGIPVRSSTQFWIASAAKQFVSTSILKCFERGLLRFNDPISRFFPDAPADKRNITVEQLLAHLSGLDQSYVSEGLADRETAVRRMLEEQLVDKPGSKFRYSNSNYQLAAAIVEVVSGRSYQEFVAKDLWRRAGLRNTGFSGDAGAQLVAPAIADTPARLTKSSWGGEGVYSTTRDLLRWYRVLRSDRLLAPANVNRLFDGIAPIGEGKVALGWFVGQTEKGATRIFTRGNESFGPNALIYVYPETDTVIVVLSHAGQANDDTSWSRLVHGKIEKLLSL
jgi:CubicO group peptidase (beta-lactamase class C family)